MRSDTETTWKNPVPSLYELERYYGDAPLGSVAYVVSKGTFYKKEVSKWREWTGGTGTGSGDGSPLPQGFGTRSFRTIAQRNALPVAATLDVGNPDQSGERRVYMPVWVAATKKSYVLHVALYDALTSAEKLAALADNSNWIEYGSPAPSLPPVVNFNWNRAITASGSFYGITVGGSVLTEGLEKLLFVAEAPTASLGAVNPVREFGAAPLVLLNWSAAAKTNPITSIVVNGVVQSATATVGTETTATAPNTDTTFAMSVSTGTETTPASTSVSYRHYRFWFTSSTDLLGASEVELSTLLKSLVTKEFATSRQMNRDFILTGQYIYFAYLAAYGDASFVVGGLPNTAYQSKVFTYTNASGFPAPFKLYRSGNAGTGSIGVQLQ